jgi:hypothetical protein
MLALLIFRYGQVRFPGGEWEKISIDWRL